MIASEPARRRTGWLTTWRQTLPICVHEAALIALPDNGFEHVLASHPDPGVQVQRMCLLAPGISRDLDAAYVRIELIGATAELRIRLPHEVPCDG